MKSSGLSTWLDDVQVYRPHLFVFSKSKGLESVADPHSNQQSVEQPQQWSCVRVHWAIEDQALYIEIMNADILLL